MSVAQPQSILSSAATISNPLSQQKSPDGRFVNTSRVSVGLFTAAILAPFWLSSTGTADDWPRWLGSQGDSVWRETDLVDSLPEGDLKPLWTAPIAGGYAGPAVAGGRVFVTDYQTTANIKFEVQAGLGDVANAARPEITGRERVLAFDATTGQPLWQHADDVVYKIAYNCGPRTTPCVDDERVFTLGAEGRLLCLNVTNGDVVWSKNLKQEYQIDSPVWGFSGNPIVDGDHLICLVGGEGSVIVAFDKRTGKELWKSLSASQPGYSTPAIINAGGVRQLLVWHADALNGLDPETGKVYWTQPLSLPYGMSIATPRVSGDLIFVGGIGEKSLVVRLASDRPAVELVWRGTKKTGLYPISSTPFIEDGTIYGADTLGELRAVKIQSGERLWQTYAATGGGKRPIQCGNAFVVKQGSRYFLASETGDLIIANLTPNGYEELSRAKLLEPTGFAFNRDVVWSHPAFANRCVFARNDKQLTCVSLAKPK